MLSAAVSRPRRVLMTVDAVGGVWRYAVDLAASLNQAGIACLLAGLGPRPRGLALPDLPDTALVWTAAPLDWMVADERALDGVAAVITELARDWRADLVHLNLPSQAVGISSALPVLVVSHSCVPTWWEAVRGGSPAPGWAWHLDRNRLGLSRADCVLVPSASHGAALRRLYGTVERLRVVHNASAVAAAEDTGRDPFVLAAGRWWDEGKNAAVLDRAARSAPWPVLMAGPLAGPNGERVVLADAVALGEVPPAELRARMGRAAIFAAPSRYEPFGLAVLEAAMQQAALLLSDIPTFRELWEGAALFARPDDPQAFAAAIRLLSEDEAARARLGVAARRIARGFTPSRQLEGVLGGYAAAMARSGQG